VFGTGSILVQFNFVAAISAFDVIEIWQVYQKLLK